MSFTVKPIGTMKSVFHFKNGTPRQASLVQSARGVLTIDKSVFNNPEHSLEGLEEFSHAWILFIFHKNNNVHTKAKVKPPRLDGQRVGVFSSRSPYRPNNIGLSLAKIDKVEGSSIYFSGIDLVDGTPVLDIKPYIPDYDRPPDVIHKDISLISNDSSLVSSCDNKSIQESKNSGNSLVTVDRPNKDHSLKKTQGEESLCSHEFAPSKNIESVNCVDNCVMKSVNEELENIKYSMEGTVIDENDNNKSLGSTDEILHPVAEGFYEVSAALKKAKEKLGSKVCLDGTDKSEEHEEGVLSDHQPINADLGAEGGEDFDDLDFLVGDIISKAAFEISTETLPSDLVSDSSFKDIGAKSNKGNESKKESSIGKKIIKKKKLKADLSEGDTTADSFDSEKQSTVVAPWLAKPPVSKLNVTFTTQALQQLQLFSKLSPNPDYQLQLVSNAQEAEQSISDILKEEPRSVYRRQQCQDSLYYFTIDILHVTCWFDGDIAQVVRVKPVSQVAKLQNVSNTSR